MLQASNDYSEAAKNKERTLAGICGYNIWNKLLQNTDYMYCNDTLLYYFHATEKWSECKAFGKWNCYT